MKIHSKFTLPLPLHINRPLNTKGSLCLHQRPRLRLSRLGNVGRCLNLNWSERWALADVTLLTSVQASSGYSYESYDAFIAFETKPKKPDLILSRAIYERAIADVAKHRFAGSSNVEFRLRTLWTSYTNFLVRLHPCIQRSVHSWNNSSDRMRTSEIAPQNWVYCRERAGRYLAVDWFGPTIFARSWVLVPFPATAIS